MKDRPKEDKIYLYGKHALREALAAKPAALKKVFLDKNARDDADLMQALAARQIAVSEMKEGVVERDAVHQGVIAEIVPSALYSDLADVIDTGNRQAIVLLDEIQDPHNVGAIIRSAAAFGAAAVLLPEHNQSPITGTVIKTSAGMAFRIPIVRIGNVNQTLRLLKEKGFWIYGLAGGTGSELGNVTFDTSVVFVVGNESTGIREKTLELCDVTLSISIDPRCESLNASVAASVVLYEYMRGQR